MNVSVKKEEFVDLVDAAGVIKQSRVPRSEIDKFPQLHMQIIVGVIVNNDGNMLVQQRAKSKKVNPGDIDHICGGMLSGETPEQGLIRETTEEAGVGLSDILIVAKGVNTYNRFRYLLVGRSEDTPGKGDPTEVAWVRFVSINELKAKHLSGEFTFVDEFFKDTEMALSFLKA